MHVGALRKLPGSVFFVIRCLVCIVFYQKIGRSATCCSASGKIMYQKASVVHDSDRVDMVRGGAWLQSIRLAGSDWMV
jgi:hypothetical protein